ncbi:hypothetical protein PIROE2DRAFT_18006 [Piromyces sp. E2]|nr:hypothetical protein PIROE2DRAFT_18006 [Piromyces sp. E2]|eukprot:OUM57106.1 hypothetical protein PIROE2DRAFT_18006 [Piromyces sp. E2]
MEENLKIETKYKTLYKCKSFIVSNDKKEVSEYKDYHNHPGKKLDVSISLVKHKIKDEMKKSSIPSYLKPNLIFNKISQEIGYICPDKLFTKYKYIFADGTSYTAPPSFQQVSIIRTYVKEVEEKLFHCDFEKGISNAVETNNASEFYNNHLKNSINTELKNIGSDKYDIVENWFNCLINLYNKFTESESVSKS